MLRPGLEYADAGYDVTGDRGTVIYDPVRHSFFRMSGAVAKEVLQFRISPKMQPREDVLQFLDGARLLQPTAGQGAKLYSEWQRGQHSWLSRILHSYISFRIPLFCPEPFLDATLDIARVLVSRAVVVLLLGLASVGGYFALQQWDHFSATLFDSFSLLGASYYAATLVGLKIFHELGHAYVARHYGVRVPSIGIAFMVMVPMLYTDATDAWRLSSRGQRFLIGAAGVLVELGIAAVALFLWAFMPDGVVRSVAFFVAVTAWMTSVLVNLSPFMRFDGYHLLVDGLGMHSAAPRSFALFRWWLKEVLFGLDAPPPEFFTRGLRRGLIGYAICTCLYRLSLFLGIAWLLYVQLPKAVGLPLACIEVYVFVLMPIVREVKEWKAMGMAVLLGRPRGWLTVGALAVIIVLGLLPLDRSVSVPAVFLPRAEALVFPPEAAQVVSVAMAHGTRVSKGAVLVQLLASDLAGKQRLAQLRLDISDSKLARVASDAKDRAQFGVIVQEREAAMAELQALKKRSDLLTVRAPLDGIVTADAPVPQVGQWVGLGDPLFHIVDGTGGVLTGFVVERDSRRIANGAQVVFVPEDASQPSVMAHVNGVGMPGGEGLALNYLRAATGGAVATAAKDTGQKSEGAAGYLPVAMTAEGPAPAFAVAGTAHAAATPRSFASFVFGRFITVALRESGF